MGSGSPGKMAVATRPRPRPGEPRMVEWDLPADFTPWIAARTWPLHGEHREKQRFDLYWLLLYRLAPRTAGPGPRATGRSPCPMGPTRAPGSPGGANPPPRRRRCAGV